MLIDCGTRTPVQLHNAGIPLSDIDIVYISHQHGDHAGGLEEFAFTRYDWMNRPQTSKEWKNKQPIIFGNKVLLEKLWNHTLKGGLESMEGFIATLDTYFNVIALKGNEPFFWHGWKFDLVQQVHVMTGSTFMDSYGLFMSKEGYESVYFTIDTQFYQPEQVKKFFEAADIIIEDCELTGVDTRTGNMDFKSGVHSNYAQLAGWESANATKLSPEIKSKIWLSHYQDFYNEGLDYKGQSCNWDEMAYNDGFAGFLFVGQELEIGRKDA